MKVDSAIPNWLRKTQNNSWEPEIFISGIVLYGLIQTPEQLENFRYFFKREVFNFSNDIDTLIAILNTGIQWLIFGLILHLFFRGIWIGLVGLSYVFPNGINQSNLKYKGKFQSRIDRVPPFEDQIIKLEKISSSIFSISYFIFMSITGAYVYLVTTIVAPVYVSLYFLDISLGEVAQNPSLIRVLNFYASSVMILSIVYLFDFLTLGLLRKVKWLSKIYYPLYLVISTLTFSSLYRNVYYTLISNFKRWKVIGFIVVFLFITLSLFNFNAGSRTTSRVMSRLELYGGSAGNFTSGGYYANMPSDKKTQTVTIQNDIISEDVLRVFVSHNIAYEDSIKVNCDYAQLTEVSNQDSLKLVCMSGFFGIEIDDSVYQAPDWRFHKDLNSKHRGILGYVDIAHLERGPHKLNVTLKNWRFKNYSIIPFYKD